VVDSKEDGDVGSNCRNGRARSDCGLGEEVLVFLEFPLVLRNFREGLGDWDGGLSETKAG